MINNNQENLLEKLGLTTLEAQVYLHILKNGVTTVPDIHKTLKMDKSSTYRIIDNLVKRDLLVGLGEEYGKEFMVSDPNLLIELAHNKKKESEVVFSEISELVEEMVAKAGENYKRENITVFEGSQSYRRMMEKRLEHKVDLIREIANAKDLVKFNKDYWPFVDDFIKRRVERGIKLRSIDSVLDKPQKYEQTDLKFLKEVRYLPAKFKLPASFATFGDYTGIINMGGRRRLGILIKDKLITGMFNNMFDFMWEGLK